VKVVHFLLHFDYDGLCKHIAKTLMFVRGCNQDDSYYVDEWLAVDYSEKVPYKRSSKVAWGPISFQDFDVPDFLSVSDRMFLRNM